MPKKKTEEPEAALESPDASIPHPRLTKLKVRNFRCIGSKTVEIDLDDIVVLVGGNNVGKSSILRAYQIVMSHGSAAGNLTEDDFPGRRADGSCKPEIELVTVVYDKTPGEQWIQKDQATGDLLVRERWIWGAPGKPIRQGFNVVVGDWDDKVPWGAPNVANSRRPEPHRVDAFANPQDQADEIIKLLKTAITERIKNLSPLDKEKGGRKKITPYQELLNRIGKLQKEIAAEAEAQVVAVQTSLTNMIAEIFPDYQVKFDARPEDNLDKCLNLFKANPQLQMGHKDGYLAPVAFQGSGARRTLMWTALRILSEENRKKKKGGVDLRPHLLLIDEPEICLHPGAIREACRVLYDLPQKSDNWQVMVTTHSPAFVDFSRDNTTIIRVEQDGAGDISSATIFRPRSMSLGEDDRQNLKMLNLCDPYVAEFMFGGRTVIVEGDTEYSALRYVIEKKKEEVFSGVHVVRARGKAVIATLAKIMSHFGASYAILHDSDMPTYRVRSTGKEKKNPAWTENETILSSVKAAPDPSKVRLIASVPNFELAYFGEEVTREKPYTAFVKVATDDSAFATIEQLLIALLDMASEKPLPTNAVCWDRLEDLEKALGN